MIFLARRVPRIAVTLGDPAGIGPEVALKAVRNIKKALFIPVIIGRSSVCQKFYPDLFRELTVIKSFEQLEPEKKYLYEQENELPLPVQGEGSVNTGRESLQYIDTSIRLWKEKHIDCIVTGPVHKGFIQKSGIPFIGHTEYIAERTGGEEPYMLMYSHDYRVLLSTTHIPVMDVRQYLTVERIYKVITRGHLSVKAMDGRAGKIAVAGFDPHCGDDGAIGAFDTEITAKAVALAQKEGIDVAGPFSADTLFLADRWKQYNLAIAQYHDQGLIPFKLLSFEKGVNVTLGLSVIRTSVDHGTAYDIAGKNTASFASMTQAINLAYNLILTRR